MSPTTYHQYHMMTRYDSHVNKVIQDRLIFHMSVSMTHMSKKIDHAIIYGTNEMMSSVRYASENSILYHCVMIHRIARKVIIREKINI